MSAFNIGNNLDELREAKSKLEPAGITPHPIDHEVTKSLYFQDPDGNGVELYVDASDAWRREPQRVAQLMPLELVELMPRAPARRTRAGLSSNESSLSSAPTVRLLARATHQHRAFALAQAISLKERLDGVFVVDDREGARPVGAPQAALETPRVEYFRERVPDVVVWIRSFDSVQAPLTLITTFLRLARATTFGRSAHGSAAAAELPACAAAACRGGRERSACRGGGR